MRLHRLVGALLVAVALLLPATAAAQTNNPFDQSVSLTASLQGNEEVQPGAPEGFGFARVAINLLTGEICYRLSVANTDMPTAAHIHVGGPGVAGPVVVPFDAPSDGFANGCVIVAVELALAIAANPSGYYVNIHTAAYPAGAVRGQLGYLGKTRPVLPTGPIIQTIAEGLNSPRGIDVGTDGAVYYSNNGAGDDPSRDDDCFTHPEFGEFCIGHTGQVLRYSGGETTTVATALPSAIGDVVVDDAGDTYVIEGLGGEPGQREDMGELGAPYGQLLHVHADGFAEVADVAGYEGTANPHPASIDTNPYSVAIMGDGFLVADAGGNDVLHVDAAGVVSTYAVFPDQMAEAPPEFGLPPGTIIPFESVPTGIVEGPDGAYYVTELAGHGPGLARVWRLDDNNADGDALDAGEATVFADGFTELLDVAFDSQGRLYVIEFGSGRLLRMESDGSWTEVLGGLVAPTGLAIGPDDTIYISNFGAVPFAGQILKVTLIED